MSVLEALPIELFGEMASYLNFWDKKALSITSKCCHTMIGRFECPNQLTWLIYQCRDQVRFHEPLYGGPQAPRSVIFQYIRSPRRQVRKDGPLKVDIEELMSPYFPKCFPECKFSHYCMMVAQDDVRSRI